MNVKTMRLVDRWIGIPACALLTLLRRLDDWILRRSPDDPPSKIAVIKLAEQGATVLASPALNRARDMVGAEKLYFVVFAENRFILDLLGVVPEGNVISIRTGGMVRVVLDTLRAVRRMRREGIDATVDFEFFARSSAILSYMGGARIRAGYHAFHGEASWRGDLMTHRHSLNPFLHASEMFLALVESLERPAELFPACDLKPDAYQPLPRFEPAPEECAEVAAIVRERLGIGEMPPTVLLNANCGDLLPLRRWPLERYVDLARRLLARYPELHILLTGAPDEAPAAEALAAEIGNPRCVSMAGTTTLRQLIVLYALSELMVTNDSGPAHYATLTSMDVVTIFGPETPAVFGSRAPRSHLLWAGIACSPCVNAFNDRQSACGDNLCMQKIGVDQVFATVCRALESRRPDLASAGDDLPAASRTSQSV